MAEEPTQPASHVPPPPDLPQASPPPAPSIAPPIVGVGSAAGVPPLSGVRITTGADDVDAVASNLAPINTRFIAALIDLVVALGVQISARWILPEFAARAAWLLAVGYLVTRDSLAFLGGQSVGKKAMKLRAVTLGDQSLTGNWQAALIRNGVLIIPMFAFIELFLLLTRENHSGRGLRLGDEWAKTRVIVAPDPPTA